MIPLMINNTHLCKIFEPSLDITAWTEQQIRQYSIDRRMLPTQVVLNSETYARDADRTADFELEDLVLVNRKAKPEFTWSLLRADYVEQLMSFLGYTYDFMDATGYIIPIDAPVILIAYRDFTGTRTIATYLGQTIEGTLLEYEGTLYWENFRVAFPER